MLCSAVVLMETTKRRAQNLITDMNRYPGLSIFLDLI